MTQTQDLARGVADFLEIERKFAQSTADLRDSLRELTESTAVVRRGVRLLKYQVIVLVVLMAVLALKTFVFCPAIHN